jgi:hypothetical protein
VILMLIAAAGGIAVVCALGWGLAEAGLRAGDRPGDVTVAAVLGPGPRPVIIATVRYRVTAVAGQAGGRLRVIGVPVVSGGPAGAGRPAPAARAGDRD